MRVTTRVDTRGAVDGLERIHRSSDRDVARVLTDRARRRVLPVAKRLAPGIVAASLVVREGESSAVLTTSATGMRRRIVGFTNVGGTVSTPIVPRRARALRLANGKIVARVSGPRTVAGMRYLEKAAQQGLGDLGRDVDRDLPRIMQRRLDGITA